MPENLLLDSELRLPVIQSCDPASCDCDCDCCPDCPPDCC
jgi:hypothetical protein